MNRVSAPDPTLSSPLKVRALRIPADGSPPHLITLQTIIAEPAAPPEPSSYLSLLSHLEEDEKPRHVPDVTAFWGRSGWEGRSCAWMDYGDRSMEERGYYVFWAADAGSKFLANRAIDWRGDAFVLRVVERRCLVAADFVDVGDYLRRKRHEHLFPEYQDVDEAILQSDIVGWIARDLLQAGLVDGGGRGRDGGRGAANC